MIDYDKILCGRIKEVKPSGIRKYFDLLQGMEGASPWVSGSLTS